MGIEFGPLAIYRGSKTCCFYVEKGGRPFAMVARSIAAMSQALEATIVADDAAEWGVAFMGPDNGPLNREGLTLAQAKAYVGNISDAADFGASLE
jgi:hypothetical protein